MTTTLIILLITTIFAIIILPFCRSLMKDRAELHENPIDTKFSILISRINELLMNGKGDIIVFKDDPRMLNIFDQNHANMIVNLFYSTGSLSITLKYKYFNIEHVKKMQFDKLRHADTFKQQDIANHFCEEATIAIQQHQSKVNKDRGLKDSSGEYIYSKNTSTSEASNPINLIRDMYNVFSFEQKLAWVIVAQMIYTADGSSVDAFKNHPQFPDLLLNFQVNYSDAIDLFNKIGATGIFNLLKESNKSHLATMLMPIFPFVIDSMGPNMDRIEKFYSIYDSLGYSKESINNELEKMMLMMQHFGL